MEEEIDKSVRDSLEMTYAELSEKFISLSEKYEELVGKYLSEKKLNDELILDMEKITKNTSKLSTEFIKTSRAYIELQQKAEHGIFLEYENDRVFLPVMADLKKYTEQASPKRVRYTFMPEEIQRWFKEVEMLTANDLEKIVYVKNQ